MESKIYYHVLSMDEIVFDNRNKAYGAFVVRQVYEKTLLKAIILSVSLFALGMSSPTILRKLGLIATGQIEPIIETKIFTEDFVDAIILNKTIQKPPLNHSKSDIMIPVREKDVPKEIKPAVTNPTTSSGIISNGPTGGASDTTGLGGKEPAGGTYTHIVKKPDIYFGPVEQMPAFIGSLEDYIDDNLTYPIPEKEDEIEGVVKVQFVVNEDGSIEQVSINKSSGYINLDVAAINLVKSMPKFKPGKQNGQAVRVLCVLPIGFELQ